MPGFDIRTIPKLPLSGYQQAIKSLFGTSLVAYWPLNEASGTIAYDQSGNGRHGVYTNVTLGQTGVTNGEKAALFVPASSSYANVFAPSLAGAIDFTEFSLLVFAKAGAGLWEDVSTNRMIANLYIDANNLIQIMHSNTVNDFRFIKKWNGNFITKNTLVSYSDYFLVSCLISKSENKQTLYLNKEKVGADSTYGGDVIGSLAAFRIGSLATSSANIWNGNMCGVILLNRMATLSEIETVYNLANQLIPYQRMSVVGDSISASATGWQITVKAGTNDNRTYLNNHAVSGHSVMTNMDAQVLASANDNSNIIIIALGTNDDNAGNMATLQAEAEENIVELKASNPNATIYWMNVLPRWTDTGGATPVDKANIRTAIAAACTAQSITCWDTFSTPWITAAQTSDGTHPTAAGFAAMATEVLARL